MAIDAKREISEREITAILGATIATHKDIHAIQQLIANELGFNPPPFALIRLLQTWNSLHPNEPIAGIDKYIDDLRVEYLDDLQAMQKEVSTLPHLKQVFPSEWFDDLLDEIVEWSGTGPFTTKKHGAFISHLQF